MGFSKSTPFADSQWRNILNGCFTRQKKQELLFEGLLFLRKKGRIFVVKDFFFLPVILVLFSCAGLTPPSPGVPESQYENGLRFSEKEFRKPIDILQGEWKPTDSSRKEAISPSPIAGGIFRIQIISLKTEKHARTFQSRMAKEFPETRFFVLRRGKYWAVQVGPFATREAAVRALQSTWRKRFPDAWIVRSR